MNNTDTSQTSTPTPEPSASAGPNCAESTGSRLLPCPFCGTTKHDIVDYAAGVAMHSYPGGYRIECEKCGATGPWDNEDPVRALNLWDARHSANT